MTPKQKSTSRVRLFRALSVGIPTIAGLFVIAGLLFHQGWLSLEGGRLNWHQPPLYLQEPGHEITGHRYLYDETLGWRNIPNWRATTFDHPLSINAKGLRDTDHSYEKPKGTKRILVLGDSYAWGYGVADDEVFAAVLESRLTEQDLPWEVINTGVSGWGTDQQLLYLQNEGIKYNPDVVLLAFFIGNDIDNNLAANQYSLNKPVFVDYDLSLGNVPVPKPGRRISEAVSSKLKRLDGAQLTTTIIKEMSDTCAERQCDFVLMKFGIFLAPTLPYALNLEQQFVASKTKVIPSVSYLDLDLVFRDNHLNAVALTQGNDDGHWNAFGHRRVAMAIEEFLIESELLHPNAN